MELGSEVTEHEGYSKASPKLTLGVASGRPVPGVVPDAGLAGGSDIHLDAMSTMDAEGIED